MPTRTQLSRMRKDDIINLFLTQQEALKTCEEQTEELENGHEAAPSLSTLQVEINKLVEQNQSLRARLGKVAGVGRRGT